MTTPSPYFYLHRRNSFTYGSLLAGMLAVFLSKAALWSAAWALIAASVFLDTFDGKFAGLFDRGEDEAAFGVQFDSLADGVVFGLVPVACLFLMLNMGGSVILTVIWSVAAFAYLVAGLTRLGCYNVHQATGDTFVGIPIPLAALVLATLALVTRSPIILFIVIAACSWAMVMPLRIPRPAGWKMVLFVSWVVVVFLGHVVNIGSTG